MESKDLTKIISEAKKKTPVKVYLTQKDGWGRGIIPFENCEEFGVGSQRIIFGDWEDIEPVLERGKDNILNYIVENDCRNSALPLLDYKKINARIEPGAIIRDHVEIGDNAVIMMGAILNIGAVVGAGTMIDMGAILGGRAIVGKNCHIGAGAVLAGVIEPPSAKPVTIEDDVLIGANAVVIEGVTVGKGAIVAAGAVVIEDVPAGAVMAGVPAKLVKMKDEKTEAKTEMIESLRLL